MPLAPTPFRPLAARLRWGAVGAGWLALRLITVPLPSIRAEDPPAEPAPALRLAVGPGALSPAAPWWAGEWWVLLATPAPPPTVSPRTRLAEMVKNGRLAGKDAAGPEERAVVSFRPWRRAELGGSADPGSPPPPPEPVKEPGPLEDAALAAAVRGRIAADPALGKLGVTVSSQAGRVSLRSGASGNPPPTLEQTAALLSLALGVDGLVEVSADLPAEPAGSGR